MYQSLQYARLMLGLPVSEEISNDLHRLCRDFIVLFELSKITKPAQVGNTSFGVGINAATIVERAQREYEYRQNANFEAVRINQSNRLTRAFHLESVLAELVELKGMKEALEAFYASERPLDNAAEIQDQYNERKEKAWARAREMLQGFRDGDATIPF